jgi:hypothetical protein
MHNSTVTTEKCYRKAYNEAIRAINEKGKVEVSNNKGETFTINTGYSMRRADIYSLVAQLAGYGHCERTAARYIKKILKKTINNSHANKPNSAH